MRVKVERRAHRRDLLMCRVRLGARACRRRGGEDKVGLRGRGGRGKLLGDAKRGGRADPLAPEVTTDNLKGIVEAEKL